MLKMKSANRESLPYRGLVDSRFPALIVLDILISLDYASTFKLHVHNVVTCHNFRSGKVDTVSGYSTVLAFT